MIRRVLCTFGNGDCGRLGHGRDLGEQLPRVVAALLDLQIKSVAAGGAHTAVVADDGTVLTFGLNDRGQLGHSAGQPQVAVPQEVPLPEPARFVSAGHYHTLCVADSGNVWAWGCNKRGQLGLGGSNAGSSSSSGSSLPMGMRDASVVPEPRLVASLRGTNITSVAAGAEHSLALTSGGEVYSWGSGDDGRLGHGVASGWRALQGGDEGKPRLMRSLQTLRIDQVSAGHMHSACRSHDGRLFFFGHGRFNQLGTGRDVSEYKPVPLPSLRTAVHVACGGLHSLLASYDGSVHSWGANQNGVLGLGHRGPQHARVPVRVAGAFADQVAAGWKHSALVTQHGKLYTFGWGGSQGTALSYQGHQSGGGGQLGHGDEFDYWAPTHVAHVKVPCGGVVPQDRHQESGDMAWKVSHVACGLNHTAAVVEIEERSVS